MMVSQDETEKGAWQPNQLAAARQQINQIDEQLVDLLTQRFEAVIQVNQAKQTAHIPVMDQGREDQVLDRVAQSDPNPATRAYMQDIFKTIMRNSRAYQAQLKKDDH